jgi:pyrophosphatase PpaX
MINLMLKAVLFDFDGTLADTLPLSFKAFKAVFAKYDGRVVTEEQLVAMFGPTEDDIIRTNLRNSAARSDAIADYYEIYKQRHTEDIPHNPEITSLLTRLKQQGTKIGVVTGKSKKAFLISSEALQLSEFFDLAITGDDVEKPKPDPEGILKALNVFGATKDEAVMIGDSNADIKAGKAAGVRSFAVQWLSVSQSCMFEIAPDLTFYHIREFMDWQQKESHR